MEGERVQVPVEADPIQVLQPLEELNDEVSSELLVEEAGQEVLHSPILYIRLNFVEEIEGEIPPQQAQGPHRELFELPRRMGELLVRVNTLQNAVKVGCPIGSGASDKDWSRGRKNAALVASHGVAARRLLRAYKTCKCSKSRSTRAKLDP